MLRFGDLIVKNVTWRFSFTNVFYPPLENLWFNLSSKASTIKGSHLMSYPIIVFWKSIEREKSTSEVQIVFLLIKYIIYILF